MVGNDKDVIAEIVEPFNRRLDTFHPPVVVFMPDVTGIVIDDSVTVEGRRLGAVAISEAVSARARNRRGRRYR